MTVRPQASRMNEKKMFQPPKLSARHFRVRAQQRFVSPVLVDCPRDHLRGLTQPRCRVPYVGLNDAVSLARGTDLTSRHRRKPAQAPLLDAATCDRSNNAAPAHQQPYQQPLPDHPDSFLGVAVLLTPYMVSNHAVVRTVWTTACFLAEKAGKQTTSAESSFIMAIP